MKRINYNILIISAYPPSRSGGIAQGMMDAFEEEGHTVDFFTMYSFPGQKENQYSINTEPVTDKLQRLKQRIPVPVFLKKIGRFLFKTPEQKMSSVMNHGYRIPHYDEAIPPVDDETLYNSLPDKKYDFIIIYVTERMLTTPSFITIYRKYKVPILINCLDMIHFTGGCYFFGDCQRFSVGCGKCLVLDSDDENDQTHINYSIKASVYPKIQYGIICNLYSKQFALQCKLFNPSNIFTGTILIDEDVFVPEEDTKSRSYLGIPSNKRFLILSRYTPSLYRAKGYDHLIRIINILFDSLLTTESSECALVLIGAGDDGFSNQIKMDTICLGTVDLNNLIKCYTAASVFISTSIDDAGPSMVNQSMMCGTPVVTFSIGTALEVTQEGVNGYMVPNYNDNEFASKLMELYRKSDLEFKQMRITTRRSALAINSKLSHVNRILEIYKSVKDLYKIS